MLDCPSASLAAVRRQYEQYPYPPRNPQDEKKRLRRTYIDALEVMNHYLYGGRRDLRRGLRILVAGGGTGDSTIHLAEQLRQTDAEIIQLDVSQPSLDVARSRAEVRKLKNVRWICASLLDLPRMGLGRFDYINCCGVLHHLPDPEAGLAALREVLADDGGLALMLYARYGRTGVYQMQELLRLINRSETTAPAQLYNARQMLADLPATNWYKRGSNLFVENEQSSDSDIYDLLLHSTDRAYSVPELHAFLATAGLHWIEYSPEYRSRYRPKFVLNDPQLKARVAELPLVEQQAVAELVTGSITRHEFFAAARPDAAATCDELENVPFFGLAALTQGSRLAPHEWLIRFASTVEIRTRAGAAAQRLVELIDNRRTLGQIVLELARDARFGLNAVSAFALVKDVLGLLQVADVVLLRHGSVPLYRPLDADLGAAERVLFSGQAA